MPARNYQDNTTWMQRFQLSLSILCGAAPPLDLCENWIQGLDDELQEWGGVQKATPQWCQNIAIIDSARVLADNPVEGERHEPSNKSPSDC